MTFGQRALLGFVRVAGLPSLPAVSVDGETAARFAIEDVAAAIAWLEANFVEPAAQASDRNLVA